MTINADIQKLEPGTLVDLWELNAVAAGGDTAYFQQISAEPVVWQGVEYSPWPIAATGFARSSDQQPQPVFRVSDIDGRISALCLAHEDLVGSVLTRHRTFAKYLDGMPEANAAEEFPLERWIVERKSDELPGEYIEFELSSPLDFQGVMLPAQQIIANQCPFQYRGPGCNYVGPPVADEFDQPTSDPALDRCGRRPGSCKLRQWPDGVRNYGSYPGAGLIR